MKHCRRSPSFTNHRYPQYILFYWNFVQTVHMFLIYSGGPIFIVNYPRPKGHGLVTAQSYERHTSPTFNPKRYCYLKWRYIIGWLTTPFTDKICSSVTVSGTKLPRPYSNNVFTIKILRSTRISYCNLISCQCTKEYLDEQHIERFSL